VRVCLSRRDGCYAMPPEGRWCAERRAGSEGGSPVRLPQHLSRRKCSLPIWTCGSTTGNPTLIPRGEDRQGQGRPGLFSPSRRRKTLPRPSSLRRPCPLQMPRVKDGRAPAAGLDRGMAGGQARPKRLMASEIGAMNTSSTTTTCDQPLVWILKKVKVAREGERDG
jgi:hypothetical protein